MSSSRLRIGTRGSPLALWQANEVKRCLEEVHLELADSGAIEISVIKTSGDRLQQGSLSEVGGKGLFTKEIEDALMARRIDIAVHSMKDVPTCLPAGLIIDCLLPRADPRDALISSEVSSIKDLPIGNTVGTASLRRKAMLLYKRPDLKVVPLRGNVDTRLEKVISGDVDATFLALAGLKRLGRDDVPAKPISIDEMLPAVCQGIIGIERRENDEKTAAMLVPINDSDASVQAKGEREILAGLDGSCRTPIAAYATVDGNNSVLRAAIVRPDGSELLETRREGSVADAMSMAREAAAELRSRAGPGFFNE
ncbi:MAG: Porphobilinogen deaminase [Alphaproteobacteria bacterium MarineAlpha11_Bin1]|nr:MAG: Porphobilinogen deaminase [Alphaproteobacteria bacterium MarineAlpha11_Bin1]|tara:strand:- start:1020 stop:1949 length:930 start_codon:yes stop_codon:yes gene_type:complete